VFRKLVIVAAALVLSFILMLIENGLMEMSTPGWFVAKKLFAEGEDTNIALLGYSAIGLDFLIWFAILAGGYFIFMQSIASHTDDWRT